MPIGRELLWKAYPDGYLAMKGVSTVGGWVCIRTPTDCLYANPKNWTHWAPKPVFAAGQWEASSTRRLEGDKGMESVRAGGDLLPNLDPENDPATWACALRDLALAVGGMGLGLDPTRYDATWNVDDPRHRWPSQKSGWVLSCQHREASAFHRKRHFSFAFTVVDPATALAMARAQLREEK